MNFKRILTVAAAALGLLLLDAPQSNAGIYFSIGFGNDGCYSPSYGYYSRPSYYYYRPRRYREIYYYNSTPTRRYYSKKKTYSSSSRNYVNNQGFTADEVRVVQQTLKDLGYNVGKVDGLIGKRTRSAIISYQKANGFSPDGKLSEELLVSMDSSISPNRAVAGN